MNRIFTFIIGLLVVCSFPAKVHAQNSCNCWQERDTTFHYVPFAWDSDGSYVPNPPYYRNDDGSTSAITLPFNFCFWGKNINTIYINCNGNISFGQAYSTYSPDTFPTTNYEMIAPFWADVDTRVGALPGSNVVLYKITSHYMIVQWDSVRYYTSPLRAINKFNSFQLIITDGTSEILPKGNNVEYCYRQMQWTTGEASNDTNGFGGYPATVGANEGDGTKFIQIGLFDTAGNHYRGQYPPWPYDGVTWLDNKSFLFNLCSGSIAPLVSGISPCDTFRICMGDSLLIPLYFFAPVQGDSVHSNLAPPFPPGVSIYSNKPGTTDSVVIKVVGNSSNYGYNVINVYGYDNQLPPDTTYTSFVIEVDSAPKLNVKALHDTICLGDTATLTASGAKIYLWNTGATTSSIKVSPPSTQYYTVGGSDGGCNKDTLIQVVVLPTPSPKIVAKPDTICPRDSVLLIGSGGGTYKWNTGKTTDSIWVTPTVTTTYSLKASNGHCEDSTKISVFVKTPGTTTLHIAKDSICPFEFDTLTASGGTNYIWSNGKTSSSIIVNPGISETYTVYSTVTCAVDSIKQKVNVIPLPVAKLTGRMGVCKGQGDTITVSGGTSYIWSDGSTKAQYYFKNINADSTVSVELFNGKCHVDTTIKIGINTPPFAGIIPPALACAGTKVVLKAQDSSKQGPFKYLWKPGNETSDSIVVDDSIKTTYTLYLNNGCVASTSTTVTPDSPNLIACCDKAIILGDDTVINASGKGIISYHWNDSSGVICLNPPACNEIKVSPTVTTTYTVLGTDTLGCQVERVITIIVEIPCFNFTVPNVFTPSYPGQNGLNDKFYIKTENMNAWSVVIYDRWGKEMFKSSNPDVFWTGLTEGGSQAPDGVYYYIISGTCQNTTYNRQGFVQLIR